MFEKIVFINEKGGTLELPLGDTSSGYEVRPIDGLDPVDAEIVSSAFGSMDGEEEQSSRRGKRNIVFKLGYATPDVRTLRRQLYNFLRPKAKVTMRFYMSDMDMFYVTIDGTVESVKSPLFVKDPEATISVICVDPDFYDPEPVAVHGYTTPYATQTSVPYDGDVETGFVMTMNVDRTLPGITIHHRTVVDGPQDDLIFADPLVAGDVLTISTIAGDKRITRTRSGTTVSILYGLDTSSVWTMLYPGDNFIRISSGGAPIAYTIEYTNKYGGL